MKLNFIKINISILLGILLGTAIISVNLFICTAINGEKVVFQGVKTSQTIQLTNGIPISNSDEQESLPLVCMDGSGGAFIIYYHGGLSGQRVDPDGNSQWGKTGLHLDLGFTRWPNLLSDGYGGFISVYDKYVSGNEPDIYSMRFDSNGAKLWAGDGVNISTIDEDLDGAYDPHKPSLCSDGGGGAIITWQDMRTSSEIYAQRINSTGDGSWTINGVPICTGGFSSYDPVICSDGMGGAIITWQYGTANEDIYAQKINSTGDVKWTINGVGICTNSDDQNDPKICSDGSNGAIIAWKDRRHSPDESIYVQRINLTGDAQWNTDS